MSARVDLGELGLSTEQLAHRINFVNASEMPTVMCGNQERVQNLWREKTKRKEPDDLSNILRVQMGSYTEPFNRAWFEKQTGMIVDSVGEEVISLEYPWFRATLDGATANPSRIGGGVWEAKHVGAGQKMPDVVARYQPQLHAQMICTGYKWAILSVFIGTDTHEWVYVDYDEEYGARVLQWAEWMWFCIQNDEKPDLRDELPPPPPEIAEYRSVDMTGNNEFAAFAADWLANKDAAAAFEAAKKNLKELTPPDAFKAFGHGVEVNRDKRGSLRIREAGND